jgi:alkylation response protein AidB-like acyl-CoA dehydrogenase
VSDVEDASGAQAADYRAILAGVRAVAAKCAVRAEEIDQARTFPADLYDELEATGAFRICGPRRFGGLELTLAQANELVYEGARGTGSMGWLMMVGVSQSIGGGLYPAQTVEELYGMDHPPRTRGVIAPRGVAVPVEGGYLVSGQWPFASGGPNPDIVSGHCVIMENGGPRIGPGGDPETLMAMMPAAEVRFLDTWHTIGMRGTDSCDVAAIEIFVPESKTFRLLTAQTCFDTPAARLPLRVALSFSHCALALGIAQGALEDIVTLSKTKTASMNPSQRLCDDVLFRHELGQMAVELEAAKSFLDQFTAKAWQAGADRRQLTAEEILTGRLMAGFITRQGTAIVDWAYTRGGSSSVYDGSSLQMRLRDIHVATQHASCHTDPYRLLGGALLGEELSAKELF